MDAFKAFFFRYYREYLSFTASFLQDEVAARNVTLEAFFLLWGRYAEFDSETRVKTFLYLVIRNKCMAAGPGSPPADLPASLPADILGEILAFAGVG
jgi:DNA-directed RNA polymerase specialized sigma24 family protein